MLLPGPATVAALIEKVPARKLIMTNLLRGQHDLVSFLGINCDFHFLIYEAAGRPILTSMIRSLWLRVAASSLKSAAGKGT